MRSDKYALLTVDTEALPNRAPKDHVRRLMWGEHERGRAGIREMAEIGAEFGARLVFFLDMCGAWTYRDELAEVARWLDAQGQDVQLHAHPEYLPAKFWTSCNFNSRPPYLNTYPDERAEFIITYFAELLKSFTGKQPLAFRAGSFRWNAGTLRALEKNGIALSFNNSMCAVRNRQCLFSLPVNEPYQWTNGIVEIPVTEHHVCPVFKHRDWWARLQYPQSIYFRYRPGWLSWLPGSVSHRSPFLVFLLHSWSFLYRNRAGYEVYRDDRYLVTYRKLLKQLCKDYDVITSTDLTDLVQRGRIRLSHIQDLQPAEYLSAGHK